MTPPAPRRRAPRALLAGLLTALLTAPALAATPALAAEAPPPTKARQVDAEDFHDGRYVVTLRSDPAATYRGGVGDYRATRPRDGADLDAQSRKVVAYTDHLVDEQEAVASATGVGIITSVTLATNAFTANVTAEQAAELAADPRVASVVPSERLHLHAATSSTDFLGLSGDSGVWESLGGTDDAGAGIVVGVIDSGIAPENPSFAGERLGTAAGSEPWRDGDRIVFDKADGSQFVGTCQSGDSFDANDCNTKLIGARYFVDNYGADYIGTDRGETVSPRDGSGHGSHTASTAAGNHGVKATVGGRDFGEISGVAPAAKIAVYKACWSGPTRDDDGCELGDLIAAIDAAVADGVDVINFSIGGGGATSTVSVTDAAFLGAAAAGIFVSASAGNSGPGATTLDNASPWITTVAASTIPSYEATVRLGDGKAYAGGSVTVADPVSGPLVLARDVATAGAEDPQLCGPDTLDPALVAGKIVLCDRGVVDRVAKSAEVKRAGGIGMLLVNTAPNSIDLDEHTVPTIHVDSAASDALHAYAAREGATAVLEPENTTGTPSPVTPQLAGFSSRGPVLVNGGDVLKPDITAPGVAILADGRNDEGKDPTFALLSGTSMAAPHIAGLAALYLGVHPDASPAEIKSALMTTAHDTKTADGDAYTDPFGQGAGQVTATSFLDPGVVLLNGLDDWLAYIQGIGLAELGLDPVDPSDLNLPSVSIGALAGVQTVTRTLTSTRAGTYVAQPVKMAGVEVSVSPARITFDGAGEQQKVEITFRRTDAALGEFTTAALRFTAGDTVAVTLPLAVRPTQIAVPDSVTGTGNEGSVEIPVLAGQDRSLSVQVRGLTPGHVSRGEGTAGSAPQQHVVDVPEGTTEARFELAGADPDSDVDLTVYQMDPFGGLMFAGNSLSPTAHETIVLRDPQPGRYILEVATLSGEGTIAYDLTSYLVGADAPEGALRADPAELTLHLAETTKLTVSWSGLSDGGRWYGRIIYGDTGAATDLHVTTSGTAPVDDVEPAAEVDPDVVRPGTTFTLRAVGLPAATAYDIELDDAALGAGITGDDGTLARHILLPQDTELGGHEVTVTAGDTTVGAHLTAAALVVHTVFENVSYSPDGGAEAYGEVVFSGDGTVHTRLATAAGTIVSEQDLQVTQDPIFSFGSERMTAVAVSPGDYVITAWADTPEGPGPLRTVAFHVDKTKPNALTLTPHPGDENAVDMRYDNAAGSLTQATIRSKTCAGPLVFGSVWIDKPVITATFDLTGITGLDVIIDGKVVGSYANPGSERCADHTEVSHDFWSVVSAPKSGASQRAAGQLDVTVNNRYPAYSAGFELSLGYGTDYYGPKEFDERIPHTVVTEPGPVVTREVTMDAGAAFWTRAFYEVSSPDIHLTAHRVVLIPAVSPEELLPVPAAGGGSGAPGGGSGGGSGHGGGGAHGSHGSHGGDLAATGGGMNPALATGIGVAAVLAVIAGALLLVRRRRS